MAGFGRRSMRSPRKRTAPELGRGAPARQEKSVVFPAPFGPMMPKTSPSLTSKWTAEGASRPRKRFESLRTESSASGMREAPQPPPDADESLRLEEHDHDQQAAVDEEERVAQRRDGEKLDLQRADDERAEDRPGDRAEAADDRHQHDAQTQAEVEDRRGRDVLEVDRVQPSGERDERRRQRVRAELETRRVDTDRLRGVDVLLDRVERHAEGAPLHPRRDRDGDDGEADHGEVVRVEVERLRRHPQAARAAGELDGRGPDAHRLADADGGDGEVGAAQTEGRQSDDDGKDRREQCAERQREKRIDVPQRQQHGRVRADAEERGVAERDLPGEAAEEIPRRGEDHGKGEVPEVVERAALEEQRRGQREDRRGEPQRARRELHRAAALRSKRAKRPGSPCGNATSATKSSAKLTASCSDVDTDVYAARPFSSAARTSAPTATPVTLSIPPRTMMQNAFRRKLRPKSGVKAISVASIAPAIPAKALPRPKAIAEMRSALTPERSAASRFCVTARMALPSEVRWRMTFSTTSDSALAAKTSTDVMPRRTPRTSIDFIV